LRCRACALALERLERDGLCVAKDFARHAHHGHRLVFAAQVGVRRVG
jgi:hypothetical protein